MRVQLTPLPASNQTLLPQLVPLHAFKTPQVHRNSSSPFRWISIAFPSLPLVGIDGVFFVDVHRDATDGAEFVLVEAAPEGIGAEGCGRRGDGVGGRGRVG